MANKLMYTTNMMIHKITPSVDYNKCLKRLDTQHNESTNQNLEKCGNETYCFFAG